ncbi:type II CRISPR RNA-guided endonuclease Cas9 [Algibacter sp. 2305UL17-15]|uniref:type II CRISPR RNA-guided endonuclease Cas9 n=1 Tax=Algibacter sp. 2305UL17-15 TaxID=3231268 RepID=UPI00345AF837
MKRILGLDLGTNSIGWALVEIDHEKGIVNIIGLGSRILPMNGGEKSKFENGGILESAASKKTTDKRSRKTKEKYLLRRDRLHTLLHLLKALPEHYAVNIDFQKNGKRSGKIKLNEEPKIAYYKDINGDFQFYFMDSYLKMEDEFRENHPDMPKFNKKGKEYRLPYDWTLYYLRNRALSNKIGIEELAWVLLSYNQKRGYQKVRGLNDEGNDSDLEVLAKTVVSVQKVDDEKYKIELQNSLTKEIDYTYYEESTKQLTFLGEVKMLEKHLEKNEYIIKDILNLKIDKVEFVEKLKGGKNKYQIKYENGWLQDKSSKFKPKWEGQSKEIITQVTYNVNGKEIKTNSNTSKRSINVPTEDDWNLQKLKTDSKINTYIAKNKNSGVSSYIYSELLKSPKIKLKGDGGLITVIDRELYRKEISKIIQTQKQFYPDLLDNEETFKKAVNLLYPRNESHKRNLEKLDIKHLITDDILLYQRDLKSKKSEISNCKYEWRREIEFFNKITNRLEKRKEYLKVIHKANPYYQEFRIWDLIKRIKVYKINDRNENGEVVRNVDVTNKVISKKDNLFDFLNDRASINEYQLLNYLKLEEKEYKWNLTQRDEANELKANKTDEKPCNETRSRFLKRIKKTKGLDAFSFLDFDTEMKIWHFIYSVNKQEEFQKGLSTLFNKIGEEKELEKKIILELIKNFESITSFKNDYARYSEKAIKKLLPFMRIGKYWDKEEVERGLKDSEKKLKNAESKLILNRNERIDKVIETESINGEITDFKGLHVSSACYLVYGFFSEAGNVQYWNSPIDIVSFLQNDFKQHSLNNPIVEKIIAETLQLIKTIWEHKEFGNNEKEYFDEIHLELARELKKNASQKKADSKRNLDNRKSNERIKKLLKELKNENSNINPHSPTQQERLKILEDGVLSEIKFHKDETKYKIKESGKSISKKEITKIQKDFSENKITNADLVRYKLWLDQRYQSPYTGKIIKLSDLFNREKYEIEHIFPKERINLDAFYNKVLCETEVNKSKGAKTGYQFILDANENEIFCTAHQSKVPVLSERAYIDNAKSIYNGTKKEILLSKEIPKKFTNAQLNNTRYISKAIMGILSNIVRKDDTEKRIIDNGFKSRNLINVNGRITSILKHDWKLFDTWNTLIEPRFKRLNDLTNTNEFGFIDKDNGHNFFRNTVPKEFEDDFDKKRIDHRHHALDALVVALTTNSHTSYLNNQFGESKEIRYDLRSKLTFKKKNHEGNSQRIFYQPLQSSTNSNEVTYCFDECKSKRIEDVVLEALQNTIVSYKKNNRIINKSSNKTWQWVKNGSGWDKQLVPQQEGKRKNINKKYNWDIRRRLNEDTFSGSVKLHQETELVSVVQALDNIENVVNQQQMHYLKNAKLNSVSSKLIEKKLNVSKIEIYKPYVAVRPKEKISPSIKIEDITDISIQKILKNHLKQEKFQNQKDSDGKKIPPEDLAFSPEGLLDMNNNIKMLNGDKDHKPIYKARLKKAKGKMFPQGKTGNKKTKFVVTAGGSNNYLGVYQNNETKERLFEVPALEETIEKLKQKDNYNSSIFNQKKWDKKGNEYELLFELSPNDLVYVPTEEEAKDYNLVNLPLNKEQKVRIYCVNDFNEKVVNFVQHHIAQPIYAIKKADFEKDKIEKKLFHNGKNFLNEIAVTNQNNKKQTTLEIEENFLIKERCWKLKVDKLGKIISIIK